MTAITIIDVAGVPQEIDAEDGVSLMQAAIGAGIDGIVGECNGNLSCATCHVYLDEGSFERLGGPGGDEADMLDFTAAERRPCSRLSCQVVVSADLAGLVAEVPETQV